MNELIGKIIEYFVPCLINAIAVLYVISKIMDKKINLKKVSTYIMVFILNLITIIIFCHVGDLVRILLNTITLTLVSYIMFNDKLHRTFMGAILEQAIMFISELMLMTIFILVFGANTNEVFANQGSILTNLEISAIAIGLINIKPLVKLLRRAINFISDLEGMQKYFLIIVLTLTLNILLVSFYSSTDNRTMLYINLAFIFIYSYIVYASFSEKNKNMIFKAENKVLIDNLGEYEKMLDRQRILNHENKNQLLAIKGMIQQNENAIKYIDGIISEAKKDNQNLYAKAKRIPSGGMQGIVYQKIVTMNDKNIKSNLEISKSINNINFDKIDSKLNYDVCRILGVLLDNAIEESETLETKEKIVNISMYAEDNELVIEISNYFKKMPELEKMDEKGYTTKSDGHGYGLSLVKEIVDSNKKIVNNRSITKGLFTQIIKIKM